MSLDRLIGAVWGDTAPPSARVNLRGYVGRIRGALRLAQPAADGRLGSGQALYRLQVEPGELDVDKFRVLTERSRNALRDGHYSKAVHLLDLALALWQGRPAENVPRVPTIEPLLTALEECRLSAAEDRLDALLAVGENVVVVSEARGVLADNPDRERTWGSLMLALYRLGDVDGALSAYGQARAGMVERLGIEPGPNLIQIHKLILNRDPKLARAAHPFTAIIPSSIAIDDHWPK